MCNVLTFFALFRPHTRETLKTVRIKEGMFVFASIFWFATLVPATVIIAQRSGVISAPGISPVVIAALVKAAGKNLKCELARSPFWPWGPKSHFTSLV